MDQIINFITSNIEWLFSGIGVAILSFIVSLLVRLSIARNRTKIKHQGINIRGSLNIQHGRDIITNIGDKSDEDIINILKSRKDETNK